MTLCVMLRFDPEFGLREATLAFQLSRMRVIDEIKSQIKSKHLCFIDFLEGATKHMDACCSLIDSVLFHSWLTRVTATCAALMRVACVKRMPTNDMLNASNKRTAADLFASLKQRKGAYESFLETHHEYCKLNDDPIGMPPVKVYTQCPQQ